MQNQQGLAEMLGLPWPPETSSSNTQQSAVDETRRDSSAFAEEPMASDMTVNGAKGEIQTTNENDEDVSRKIPNDDNKQRGDVLQTSSTSLPPPVYDTSDVNDPPPSGDKQTPDISASPLQSNNSSN